MKKTITLKTGNGCRIQIVLDTPRSGLDDVLRRWTFEDPFWRCIDNGVLAEQSVAAGYEERTR